VKKRILSIAAVLVVLSLCVAAACYALAPFNTLQRHPELVSSSKDGSEYVLDNVRWGLVGEGTSLDTLEPVFKRTTIKPEMIKDIYYQSENFPPEWLAAHGQLGFIMKTKDGVLGEDGSRDIGFSVSIEARTRTDQKYDLFKGMKRGEDGFKLVYQITTYTDVMQIRVSQRKHTMEQYRLLLSHEQKVQMVKNALDLACEDHREQFYHTLKQSCVTGALEIINTVLPENNKIKFWIIPNVLVNLKVSFPKWSYKYLIEHGIAEDSGKIVYSDRYVEYPCEDGNDYKLDMATLPGYYIPADVLHFGENLDMFFDYAEAVDCLTKLQDLVSPTSPDFWTVQKHLVEVSDGIAEVEEAVLTCFNEKYERCLEYYLTIDFKKVKSKNAIRHLNQKFLEIINFKVMNGNVENELLIEEARKVLSGIED